MNPGSLDVSFTYDRSDIEIAARTLVQLVGPGGYLLSASMTIHTNWIWYVDPHPADDDEFQVNPPAGFDLLTVVRHELGHAVGWTPSSRMTNLIVCSVFDPGRLNIGLVQSDWSHASVLAPECARWGHCCRTLMGCGWRPQACAGQTTTREAHQG